jgi:transcriptional regulator with XRE-family HTH domain
VPVLSPEHLGLGKAVREIRTKRGLSQEELGLEAGLDRSYVGGVERGERNPSYGSLLKIADALGVSVSEIVARGEKLRGK